jgi:hypothetical protein
MTAVDLVPATSRDSSDFTVWSGLNALRTVTQPISHSISRPEKELSGPRPLSGTRIVGTDTTDGVDSVGNMATCWHSVLITPGVRAAPSDKVYLGRDIDAVAIWHIGSCCVYGRSM